MPDGNLPPELANLTPEQLKEVLTWNAGRSDLYYFSRYMFLKRRGYKWLRNWHHQAVCDALMRVFLGQTRRLIINIPPRYSKTELAVVNFIAFCLGNVPDSEFIHLSYASPLAINNAWQCRELVSHESFQWLFPDCRIRPDSGAKGEWRTTAGGVVYATGFGGTITGYGAGKEREGFGGAIIIDDPHKADEASSDVVREGQLEAFVNTVESRKNSPQRTPIIVIMQRLHERDLAGWLQMGGNGEEWEVVSLPAIGPWPDYPEAPSNQMALWSDKHSLEDLRRMEAAAPVNFAGQYMQSPSAAEGNIFKPDMIKIIPAVRVDNSIRWCRGYDLAATEKLQTNDPAWTAGPLLGLYPDGRLVIADMARLRGGPDEVEKLIVTTAENDRLRYGNGVTTSLPQDPGQAGKFQVRYLLTKLHGHKVHTSPESGDKTTRAEPFASQVNVGNVEMVSAPWNDALKSEMRVFPNGAHKDQVDGLSRAYSVLGGKPGGLNIDPNQVRRLAQARSGLVVAGRR